MALDFGLQGLDRFEGIVLLLVFSVPGLEIESNSDCPDR